jgi:hypothetical protein
MGSVPGRLLARLVHRLKPVGAVAGLSAQWQVGDGKPGPVTLSRRRQLAAD